MYTHRQWLKPRAYGPRGSARLIPSRRLQQWPPSPLPFSAIAWHQDHLSEKKRTSHLLLCPQSFRVAGAGQKLSIRTNLSKSCRKSHASLRFARLELDSFALPLPEAASFFAAFSRASSLWLPPIHDDCLLSVTGRRLGGTGGGTHSSWLRTKDALGKREFVAVRGLSPHADQ